MKVLSVYQPVRTIVFLLLWATLFSSCSVSEKFTSWRPEENLVSRIDSVCQLQVQKGLFPGLGVSIIKQDRGQWSKGYGYADLELKQAVNPSEHLFRIGSISKTVTAAALGRLLEKDKINIDFPISTYIASLPADKQNITLRQLGGHQAGIRHYRGIEFFSNVHYNYVRDVMEVFIHDTLLFAPGTQYAYTTYGFTLVSAAMEGALTRPILTIINEEVKRPLHLTDLKGDHIDSIQFNRVKFYEMQDKKNIPSPDVDLSNKWSGGGFLCSPEDLARFGFALTGPGYLNDQTLTTITTAQKTTSGVMTNYGIGLRISGDDDEKRWYGHSGGSIGGTSMLLIFPDENLVVVTLVNMGSAEMNDLAWKIADEVRRSQ
ncbi:MAG: beta-lactamase family protein [Bacteroidota bacterium]|nr:beta-lactamase family protein [Bacteroidota bacterium]